MKTYVDLLANPSFLVKRSKNLKNYIKITTRTKIIAVAVNILVCAPLVVASFVFLNFSFKKCQYFYNLAWGPSSPIWGLTPLPKDRPLTASELLKELCQLMQMRSPSTSTRTSRCLENTLALLHWPN